MKTRLEVYEWPHVKEVAEKHSRRMVMVPWMPEEPVGFEMLGQLFNKAADK